MSTQRKEFSFKGQKIFVGLDVHLKNWTVTVFADFGYTGNRLRQQNIQNEWLRIGLIL